LYGLSRGLSLPLASTVLLLVVVSGSYARVERIALFIGAFELAFFSIAWAAHPNPGTVARHAIDLPLDKHEFTYMAAAIIGAVFNPWIISYQQSATIDKKLHPGDLRTARWATGIGAIRTQCLTGALLIAAAALSDGHAPTGFTRVGEISGALSPVLGDGVGRLVSRVGVLGTSLVAAIVSSLAMAMAMAWGVGEVAGYERSLACKPFDAKGLYGVYDAGVLGRAALVGLVPNLAWLNISAQVLNACLLPLVIALLVLLAVKSLPDLLRLRGWYLRLIVCITTIVSVPGLSGGISGLPQESAGLRGFMRLARLLWGLCF
jgi:Mn2+/Fe2+ NRAMP family transporter